MKILLGGEVFSSNLGDGVIAESMQVVIQLVDPDVEILFFDISGRIAIPVNVSRKSTLAWIRKHIPGGKKITNTAGWWLSRRKHLTNKYTDAVANVDALVIGGGQLLMDNDLDFPLKIHALVHAAELAEIPVVFHACGVGGGWSSLAQYLFGKALSSNRIVNISTRDERSNEVLRKELPTLKHQVDLCPDPALWCASLYDVKSQEANCIGLCVMCPDLMRPHLKGVARTASRDSWCDFWIGVVSGLLEAGKQVEIFTNGGPQDEEFADFIYTRLPKTNVLRHERLHEPASLVRCIARQHGLIVTRLHAGIIAYSLGIPFAGILWDKKVDAFAQLTERRRYYLDTRKSFEAAALLNKLEMALEDGINVDRAQNLRETCLNSTRKMLVALRCSIDEQT